jgi:hypothetical protein
VGAGGDQRSMRVVFVTYLLVIATGLVLYAAIGLAHH